MMKKIPITWTYEVRVRDDWLKCLEHLRNWTSVLHRYLDDLSLLAQHPGGIH